MELRCNGKLHGIMEDGHLLEVKCRSRWCGASKEIVVLHVFNVLTGDVSTVKFRNPVIEKG